jgi:hypothetical protein
VREEGEKAQGLPKLRQAEQMLAAGWGGMGSVRAFDSIIGTALVGASLCFNRSVLPKVDSYVDNAVAPHKSSFAKKAIDSITDVFLKKRPERIGSLSVSCDSSTLAPRDLLSAFDRQALNSTDFSAIISQLANEQPGQEWGSALNDFIKNEGLNTEMAWAIMLSWLADKLSNDLALSRQAHRLLRQALNTLDDSRQKSLRNKIDSHFSTLTAGSWA